MKTKLNAICIVIFFQLFLLNKISGQQITGLTVNIPQLPAGHSNFDLCNSNLILSSCSFSFTGTPAPAIISVPKGACLLDAAGANPIGISQGGTTYYDDYDVATLLTTSPFQFQVDLSRISCVFFSLTATEDVKIKVNDGTHNFSSDPVPLNKPSVNFTAITAQPQSGLLKGRNQHEERTYSLKAFQNADYDKFQLDISVEEELFIYEFECQFYNDQGAYQSTVVYSNPNTITCSEIPRNVQPKISNQATWEHTAQNFSLHFSKNAAENPEFPLPPDFKKNWEARITERFYVITVSSPTDTHTGYGIKTVCDETANGGCAGRSPCRSFFNQGDMNAVCTNPATCKVGLFTGDAANNHLIMDAYTASNTDLYYRIHINGADNNSSYRFYGIQFTIDKKFFSIPYNAADNSVNTADLEILTSNGVTEYPLSAFPPQVTSINSVNDQTINICFRTSAHQDASGGDMDGNGPLTNIFYDHTRDGSHQYYGDLPPGNDIIIHFKNIVANATTFGDATSTGWRQCGNHVLRFLRDFSIDGADMESVDLCIGLNENPGRQIHRNSSFTACSTDGGNWAFSNAGGALDGNTYDQHTTSYGGFTIASQEHTDIVETINDPGQFTEVLLTYTFNPAPAANNSTPWNIGGPRTLCPQTTDGNNNLLTSANNEFYYAYIEIPDGFHIVAGSLTGDVVNPGAYDQTASGCKVHRFELSQLNATISFKVAMSGCPSASTCINAPSVSTSQTSGYSKFYVEFRSQLNQPASSGYDASAYYIAYGCESLTLYYHCNGGCSGPNVVVSTHDFTFDRNTFGWASVNDYLTHQNAPTLTAASAGVTLDRIYLGDDILATSNEGLIQVPTNATCGSTYAFLNFEIKYEYPNGVADIFDFMKKGKITFKENNAGAALIQEQILDASNEGTVWDAITLPPPPQGEPGWSYLVVRMNLAQIPGGAFAPTMNDLVNGISVQRQSVKIFFEGHYGLDCNTVLGLPVSETDGGHFFINQIRAQFTMDDGNDTYGNMGTTCFSHSCDPWGDEITALIVETSINKALIGADGSVQPLWAVNAGNVAPCALQMALEINSYGGFPGIPDFPRTNLTAEYRPIVQYPDDYSLSLTNDLYLQRAYIYWASSNQGNVTNWNGGPFSPFSHPSNIYYDLLNCANTNRCPTLSNGVDVNHNGAPMHRGGLINFHYNAGAHYIETNTDHFHFTTLLPEPNQPYGSCGQACHYWNKYECQQKGELRNFGFQFVRDCYLTTGTTFTVSGFHFPLTIRNSRVKKLWQPNPVLCDTTTMDSTFSVAANTTFNYTNPAVLTPISFNLVGASNGNNYYTHGHRHTFCVNINTYGAPTRWIYCEPHDPNNAGLDVSIVSIEFVDANCNLITAPTGITYNSHGLWYFNCNQNVRIRITVEYECDLCQGGGCYNPTTIRFHYGFQCNRCVITENDLDPTDNGDLAILQGQCGQHAQQDVIFTPQVPQLSFTAPQTFDVDFCGDAHIPLELQSFAGQNATWGEIKDITLIVNCPEGQSANISDGQTAYPGVYVSNHYEFDLANTTVTSNILNLTFNYSPHCEDFPSTITIGYTVHGLDGCGTTANFNGVASTVINFNPPPVLSNSTTISWNGPADLQCNQQNNVYTVTISDIPASFTGSLEFTACIPSAAYSVISSSPPLPLPDGDCYTWAIVLDGTNDPTTSIEITVNTNQNIACSDYVIEGKCLLSSICSPNNCASYSSLTTGNHTTNICCCQSSNISITGSYAPNGDITANATGGTAPYTYEWSTGAVGQTLVVTHYFGMYTVTVTDAGGCTATAEIEGIAADCGGFCTYDMSGWGAPYNQNPQAPVPILYSDFSNAFPNGLKIGCSSGSVTLTTKQAVTCFLPVGNTLTTTLPLSLPVNTPNFFTDPICDPPSQGGNCPLMNGNLRNALLAELTAATLNVYFDLNVPSFSISDFHLAYLTIVGNPVQEPEFYGMTVMEVLDLANNIVGGCMTAPYPSPFDTWSQSDMEGNLQGVLHHINVSFNHCHHTNYGQMYDCSTSQERSLRVNNNPQNGSCLNGGHAKIKASATGGSPPYSFLWSNNSTSRVIENLENGIYTVTVTDSEEHSVTSESSVESSGEICCNQSGNLFPQYPDHLNVSPSTDYDVNFFSSQEVGFYDEQMVLSKNNLNIMEGVPLIVHAGATLVIDNCTFSACRKMWKGIIVESGAVLSIRNSSIRDAEHGIYALDGSKVYVYNSVFENNIVGIETENKGNAEFNNIDFSLAGTSFSFGGSLKEPYPNQPPYGTKPKAGLILNNMLTTIGDNNFSSNNFRNMNCGIISNASTYTVVNSKFSDIINDGFYHDQFMGSAIACAGGYGINTVTVFPVTNQEVLNPTFNNCNYGIYADNLNLQVSNNIMGAMQHGIYVTNCRYKARVIIRDNIIEGTQAGIIFYRNEGAERLHALNNVISTSENKGTCIGAYESGSGFNNLTLEHNILTCSGSTYGIDISGCVNSYIYSNAVYNLPPGAVGFNGINITGCSRVNVSCNSITGFSTDPIQNSYGIAVRVSDNSIIDCNVLNLTTIGMGFFGPCTSTGNIQDNEMNEHYKGLLLNSNCVIGEQRNTGNRWIGPFASSYGADNLNSSTLEKLLLSKFTVHQTPVTIYHPLYPAYDAGWFALDPNGTPYSCSELSVCPERTFKMSMNGNPDDLDLSIAAGEVLSDEFITETRSMARQILYDKLRSSLTLLNSSSVLQNFYAANSDASIGNLQDIKEGIKDLDNIDINYSTVIQIMEDAMDALRDSISELDSLMLGDSVSMSGYIIIKEQLRSDAINLQNSIALIKQQSEIQKGLSAQPIHNANQVITTIQAPEANEKLMNEIYLQSIVSGNEGLNSSQVLTVLSIAQQCPYAGGKAVYKARTLYMLTDPEMVYDDIMTCLSAGIYRNQERSNSTSSDILIIPNPANDFVTLFYSVSQGICNLHITDVTGKIIKSIELPCDKSSYGFSVSDLKNGMYFVDVLNNGGSIGRSRLAIVK